MSEEADTQRFARLLDEARAQVVADGVPLLDRDALDWEMCKLRGCRAETPAECCGAKWQRAQMAKRVVTCGGAGGR